MASAGDRVYVGPGTYYERVQVPAGVALLGAGPEVSILDGGGAGTVIDVLGDDVVVSGFSIRNAGYAYPAYGVQVMNASAWICGNLIYWNFRGVWVEGPSDTFVQWNVSADNHDDGLDGVSSTAVFRGNTVVSNGDPTISDGDIGIYLLSVESRLISENIVVWNNEFGIWCDGLTDSADNLVYGHASDFTSCGTNPSNIVADPLFVSWSDDGDPSNDDFGLQAASPAMDVLTDPPLDADGSPRDLGAYGGQGYAAGPRPAWTVFAAAGPAEVPLGDSTLVTLQLNPGPIACDHGVDAVRVDLPDIVGFGSVEGVEVAGAPVPFVASGDHPFVVELDQVVADSSTVELQLLLSGTAEGEADLEVDAGLAFLDIWTDAVAGSPGDLTLTVAGGDDDDVLDDDDAAPDDDDAGDDDSAAQDDDDAAGDDDDDGGGRGRSRGGCSCETGAGSPGGLLLVALVALLRRRVLVVRQVQIQPTPTAPGASPAGGSRATGGRGRPGRPTGRRCARPWPASVPWSRW